VRRPRAPSRAGRCPGRVSTNPQRASRAGEREDVRQPRATTNAVSPSSDTALPAPRAGRKITALERLQEAGAGRPQAVDRLHESKAILLAACPTSFALPASSSRAGRTKAANLEGKKPNGWVARAAAHRCRCCPRCPRSGTRSGAPKCWHAAAEPLEGGRVGRGDGRVGRSGTGSRSWAGLDLREARRVARKLSKHEPLPFGPDGEVLGLYRKIHLFDVEGRRRRSTANSEAEEPGEETRRRARRGLADRADRLLTTVRFPRAVPDPRAGRRRARDGFPAHFHDADG